MGLIEEIQEIQKESHEKWFERWYKKLNLEKKILTSASKGYSGYRISVSEAGDEYSRTRLGNPNTIELLKNKLGKGFEVCLKEKHGKNVFGYATYKSYILIRW
ncbi:hypothetical protein [Lactococcus formosensis]|uniref:hypothetical protein n=1 Tax=Lactococcus formosensis TaxID=1281486 RepID=UPI0032664F09